MKVTPRPVVIGLLSIIALSLAAATLTSPVAVDGNLGFGGGDGIDDPPSSDESVGVPLNTSDRAGEGGTPVDICVEPLNEIPTGALLLGFVLVGGSISYALGGVGVAVAVVTIGFWTLVVAVLVLTAGCPTGGMEPETVLPSEAEMDLEDGGLVDDEGGGETQPVPIPSIILLAVVAIGILGVILGLRNNNATAADESTPEPTSTTSPVAGHTQGARTAESVPWNDRSPENTIYQAWTAFVTSLDVAEPQTTTPAEYAAIALDAEYDNRGVRELTGIFQAVRYGVIEPTTERSDEAVAALRAIAQSVDDETLNERAAQLADDE